MRNTPLFCHALACVCLLKCVHTSNTIDPDAGGDVGALHDGAALHVAVVWQEARHILREHDDDDAPIPRPKVLSVAREMIQRLKAHVISHQAVKPQRRAIVQRLLHLLETQLLPTASAAPTAAESNRLQAFLGLKPVSAMPSVPITGTPTREPTTAAAAWSAFMGGGSTSEIPTEIPTATPMADAQWDHVSDIESITGSAPSVGLAPGQPPGQPPRFDHEREIDFISSGGYAHSGEDNFIAGDR